MVVRQRRRGFRWGVDRVTAFLNVVNAFLSNALGTSGDQLTIRHHECAMILSLGSVDEDGRVCFGLQSFRTIDYVVWVIERKERYQFLGLINVVENNPS